MPRRNEQQPESSNPLAKPPSRDHAEGFIEALKTLAQSINLTTIRCKKGELAGLETAFNLARALTRNMQAHLDDMTGESVLPPEVREDDPLR